MTVSLRTAAYMVGQQFVLCDNSTTRTTWPAPRDATSLQTRHRHDPGHFRRDVT